MNTKYSNIIGNIDPSIKMLLDKVKRYITAGKASVMVGCGFSMNAENDGTGQMREWNALNQDLYRSLYGKEPEEGLLNTLSPIRLASQVESSHGVHELDEIIMNALPDKSVYPGTIHKKLMRLHWCDVFTTNYDTLLERSCDESGAAYTLVTNKETLLYSKSPRIIKLHGSFPDSRPFIMSEEQFRTYPQKYPEFVNTVRQSLIENLFCLIGFSGNDPNFLSWLGWIRDVMGKQMTNAILVDYKPKGVHISERQLFEARKIDILNLADIKELRDLNSYKYALDFFLTYLGLKEKTRDWNYPDVHYPQIPGDKSLPDYEGDIKKMSNARTTYPGWLYLPEKHVDACGIYAFPFMRKYYEDMPSNKKLEYLFELDWLLDVSLYPKNVDWYMEALEYVKEQFCNYKGKSREKARQLIVSLMCIYREKRMIDEYLTVSDFISKDFFDELNPRQQSIFYYEQCLWNLSILDYKSVYAILSKWHIMENDFLGALWQVSIYAELGDSQVAEDMLLIYYSRLTTRMLLESKSEYLGSCAQMYSYVMLRIIKRNRPDVEYSDDNTIDELKRILVEGALKEQPTKSQSHGFNIGQVTNSSHSCQGGYVGNYLNANRYLKLTYLHGSTFRMESSSNIEEYGKILAIIAKYQLYQAISLTLRCGKESMVGKIMSRESLGRMTSNTSYILFTDLFELIYEYESEHNKRKDSILFGIVVPILQRLCCRAEDDQIQDLFDFVIKHVDDGRIMRNDILKTIYHCAKPNQIQRMFQTIMNHVIVRDAKGDDILYPSYCGEIQLTEESISHLKKSLKNKEFKKMAYCRCVDLMGCRLQAKQKEVLGKLVVEWRQNERKDINAFFSYNVIEGVDDEDKKTEQWWIHSSLEKFLNQDYSFKGSSESITNFFHFLNNIIPAFKSLTEKQIKDVVTKIVDTLNGHLPRLKEDDRDELFGGFRHFTSIMFEELTCVFELIDLCKIPMNLRKELKTVLMDCLEAHNPCLFHLYKLTEGEERKLIAKKVHERIFSSEIDERKDAVKTLFQLMKDGQEYKDLKASNWDFVNKISFYIQYSHSKNISDYLYILATLYAQRWLDVSTAQTFADALLAVHNQIDDYEMEIEYKVDIKYYSCLFAGVLHQLGLKHSGISIWKEFASEPEQFRDVKAGWENGEAMVVVS